MRARFAWCSFLFLSAAAPVAAQQGRLVAEVEPNDDFSQAQVIARGDTINATRTFRNDDYYAVDLVAGTSIVVGLPLRGYCASLTVYDPQRKILTSFDCHAERPYRFSLRPAASGRYYVAIGHAGDIETPGDSGHVYLYKLRVALYEPPPPGLGNPLTRFNAGNEEVRAMVAAPNGDMIVASYAVENGFARERLQRIKPDGQATTFASDAHPTGQIAIDAFGDLLVPSSDQGGVVWRYDLKTGARTIFTGPPTGNSYGYTGITIGADGDVWLSASYADGSKFSRFDALGTFKGQVSAGARTSQLTTAQNGELLYATRDSGDVYRLVNNTTPVRVISAPSVQAPYAHYGSGGLAIDQDGWIYLYQANQGKLLLFNPQYQLARDPLAQVLDSMGWKEKEDRIPESAPAWMRDRNGKMTSRLLVTRSLTPENTDPGPREILEVNPRGMGAPGADPMLHVKKKSLRNAAVNAAYADTLGVEEAGSSSWSFVSGRLPDGVTLASSGVLSGTPTRKGTFEFAVKALSGPRAAFSRLSITVGDSPPVQVAEADIANALMGGPTLTPAIVQYLDNLGNKNGRLDVGDFRAYLRSQGQLGGAPRP